MQDSIHGTVCMCSGLSEDTLNTHLSGPISWRAAAMTGHQSNVYGELSSDVRAGPRALSRGCWDVQCMDPPCLNEARSCAEKTRTPVDQRKEASRGNGGAAGVVRLKGNWKRYSPRK